MTAKAVMVLGTTSGAGKSWLTTALCRYYARQGLKVVPYKAQNMSNNARVVEDGEIGSAQYFQALAANATPEIRMNPLLLKPEKDTQSQVILMGQVNADLSKMPWHERSACVWPVVALALDELMAENDVVVIEGAGSPAEINLKHSDIVNMRIALHASAACLLVTDIDRGGAFAHLYGTWAMLDSIEQKLVKGFVLNKFRGDAKLLAPGPQMLQDLTGVPTVAILPMWWQHGLPEEDGLHSLPLPPGQGRGEGSANSYPKTIVVIAYPRISNLDEFQPLKNVPGVRLVWVRNPSELAGLSISDWIILPGSKATSSDLAWLRALGLDQAVNAHASRGGAVLGICDGLQMLGEALIDPHDIDGNAAGLGLLGVVTVFEELKTVQHRQTYFETLEGAWAALSNVRVAGYEIHHGRTALRADLADGTHPVMSHALAWQNARGNVLGVYLHGLFEDPAVMHALFGVTTPTLDSVFDGLADYIEQHFECRYIAIIDRLIKRRNMGMNQQIIQRRQLLQWASVGAASLHVPRRAWAQSKVGSTPFSLGLASGSPTHDSVVLWTRLIPPFAQTPGSPGVIVRWEVAHDDKFSRMAQSGQALAVAGLAYSVHAEVQGLEPDRWYFYRFLVGDAVSAVGRTRTFPAPEAAAAGMRLAYASCQRWEHGYFSAYRHMAQENLDLVMFLGDYIYEYPRAANGVRTPPGGWVLTLDDYRQRYATYKQDADLQAMHAACPWLVTWDDHEVQNDYAGLTEGENGPDVADFAARRSAAYQAFYEHMPVRASVLTRAVQGMTSGAEMRIYSRAQYGRLASLTMLDARQYKSPQVCTRDDKRGSSTVNPATCPAWNDPARSMLGTEQERWLDAGWGSTQGKSAVWNILGQQSLIGQRDWKAGPEQSLWNDGWDGYSAARTRLTDSARKNGVASLVALGGDVHENWVGPIKADYSQATSPAVGVEFCGTSITSRSGGNARLAETMAENPHFVFADAERKGYGVVDITPTQLKTTLRVVSDVTRQDASIETLAQFSVRSGRALVERV